jgi:Bacterial type III secretion protein (HrpB1_HrpK)
MDACLSSLSVRGGNRSRKGPTFGARGSALLATPEGPPLRKLLLHALLLAVAHGMEDDASAHILPVLVGLGTDRQRLDIAIAMIKLRRGDAEGCLFVLERGVLEREPGNDLALALQARAWRTLGRPQWRAQADALLSTSANSLVRSIVGPRA